MALILAVGLVPTGIMLALLDQQARRDAKAGLDRDLQRIADLESDALENYFERARATLLVASKNPTFADFYRRPGSRIAKVRANGPEIRRATSALAFLERLYPNAIGEACFIDATGPENARVVRGAVAPVAALSADESGNAFFAPTMAQPVGGVYQSKPYVSPDTKEWVVSNATPVAVPGRGKVGFVHFEVTVESFRREALARVGRFDLDIIDETGRVVIESGVPQLVGTPLGPSMHDRMDIVVRDGRSAGVLDVDGERVAFRRLGRTAGNANTWYVAAVEPSPAASLVAGIGPGPFAALGAVLLLAALGAAYRWRRVNDHLSDLRSSRDELEREALTDSLTGIGNHRAYHENLAAEAALRANGAVGPLTLVALDLDHLKATNDRLGHVAGDERLTDVARRLEAAPLAGARAFRIGGDEFALLLPGWRALDAVEFIGEMRSSRGDGRGGVRVEVTAGIAELTAGEPVTDLVRNADLALLEAKRTHRGAVTFTPALAAEVEATDRPSISATTLATALARAVDAKDSYTRSHCETVAEAAVLIGRELGLDPARLERLRIAALLHDVGKIGTPDSILQKPGALTDEEFEVMKRHVALGHGILLGANLVEEADWVLHHHERVDGRGYPDGLTSENIPLESRIILVADAFEAMTSDRPYRRGCPTEDALAELRRHAGTQFCEDCVGAFCRSIDRASDFAPASLRLRRELEIDTPVSA